MAFSKPASTQTRITDYVGRLLVLEPTGVKRDVKTSVGESDVVDALLWTLDGSDSDGNGPGYEGQVRLFQRMLIAQTESMIGQKILGRLVILPPTAAGKNGAYALADPTEGDEKIAGEWEREETKRQPSWSGSTPATASSDDEPPF